MRLVIDLQGAQTSSRHRGIGRYTLSLTKAMLRRQEGHDILIVLNGMLEDTVLPLRAEFESHLSQDKILMWEAPGPVAGNTPKNAWRRQTAEILREAFIADLQPDIVHVSSLFEGFFEDAVTSAGAFMDGRATAITLYDLIPLINPTLYLSNPIYKSYYQRKLDGARRAGLWLSISKSSRQEGIEWLGLPPNKVVNISAAGDPTFHKIEISNSEAEIIRNRFGITRPFLMYVGATDPRKNLSRLIGAYSSLPPALRSQHQLLIVSPAEDGEISAIKQEARQKQLSEDEIVVAPYVSDTDLIALYNLCTTFCMPSIHEGFGLPALEAMQCGAPTIASNTTSLSEIVGLRDATFDPFDENDMARLIHQTLTDKDFRNSLALHGIKHAKNFSWDESARRAWDAFEAHHKELNARAHTSIAVLPQNKPRLAYVSPLPPARTGIADYSAELLPELNRYYDIDAIVDQPDVDTTQFAQVCQIRDRVWFEQNSSRYDRILYQFGNSPFHKHMFDLVKTNPGVVTLHDFYMGGAIKYIDLHEGKPGFLLRNVYESHGYRAARELAENSSISDAATNYPANFTILKYATGIIVHSKHNRELAAQFYGDHISADWRVIPLLRQLTPGDRKSARSILGFHEEDFVVCSFGMMANTKLNHRLIQAWLKSPFANDSRCFLIFVGLEHGGTYGAEIRELIASHPGGKIRISITGFASSEIYKLYMDAADAAVQLRTQSRGETSRAALDCMAYGLPTITNKHGSMAELPEDAAIIIPDEFTDSDLIEAIDSIREMSPLRDTLRKKARDYIKEHLDPALIAKEYYNAIEYYATQGRAARRQRMLEALTVVDHAHPEEQAWRALARAANSNMPLLKPKPHHLLIDVSALAKQDLQSGIQRVVKEEILALLEAPPPGFRVRSNLPPRG